MSEDGRRSFLRRVWVADLDSAGHIEIDQAASSPASIDDAVARLGLGPVRWAIELSSNVVEQITDALPDLRDGPASDDVLRRGNEATTLRALLALVHGTPASMSAEATLDGVREYVHRGISLARVLRAVRIGHAATTEAFLRACAALAAPSEALEEVAVTSRELFAYVDELSDTMVRTYLAEYDAWSTSAAAARADRVRSLLDGGAVVDADEASRALGYDLGRTHEAVVAWSDSSQQTTSLQLAALSVLEAHGATSTLVVPGASGQLTAWGAVPVRSAQRASFSQAAVDALITQQVHVAVGAPGRGLAGFRRSHREAERAKRLEQLRLAAGRAPRAATVYADIAVTALLVNDLDAAQQFVQRELGGLAVRSASMEALRTTFFNYLDAERSLMDVAQRLHVARGTVTYRVRRAEELLGHDVTGRRLALHNALALVEELGDAVLPPVDSGL